MKHTLIIALFVTALFSASTSFGQEPVRPRMMADTTLQKNDSMQPKPEFGIKVGANFQNVSGATWQQSYNPGIYGGITAGMHMKKFGLTVEVLIGSSSFTTSKLTDSNGNKSKINELHIDVPLLFEYRFVRFLRLQVGPQYTNILSATGTNALNDPDPKVIFKSGSFSAVVGLEATLPAQFMAGVRYVYGFSNINNNAIAPSSEKWQASAFQVYVGYFFK